MKIPWSKQISDFTNAELRAAHDDLEPDESMKGEVFFPVLTARVAQEMAKRNMEVS
jgi:hypothetical protein